MLTRSPARTPVHAAYLPLLFELTALRLLTPFWPSDEHYCQFPGSARGSVQVRASCLEYMDLVAHHLAYQFEVGALAAPWRVSVAPHLAGSDGTTFAIEPGKDDLAAQVLAEDLACLAADLGTSVRRLARARVTALGPPQPGDAAPSYLSAREREVLELFLAGLGVVAIGRRLFISIHTVRNHLKHVCAKLGVSSQRELRELFVSDLE